MAECESIEASSKLLDNLHLNDDQSARPRPGEGTEHVDETETLDAGEEQADGLTDMEKRRDKRRRLSSV